MMTVRDLVKSYQREMRGGELTPARACELSVDMTSLLATVLEEIRESDLAYAQVLLGCLNTEAKANRAKIKAEITPEYSRKREAHDVQTVLVEMIRSLRQMSRAQAEEMRLQR
jgi:hypothetical protein